MINLEQAAIACANSLSGLTKENENLQTISITFKDIDNYLNTAFKAGVEFAESKFEAILKDFADYLGIETDGSLITQFIKDRNEV